MANDNTPNVVNTTAQNNADTPLVNNQVAPADLAAGQDQPQTIDESIQTQSPDPLPRVNIDQPVTPGHDAVVNHVDGSQEVAQGHVAAAIHAQEAKTGEVVSVADVEAGEAQESPRSKDPETNGPDQQEPGKTADEVVAETQPEENPEEVTPAFPSPKEDEAPAEAPAQPSTEDVAGV